MTPTPATDEILSGFLDSFLHGSSAGAGERLINGARYRLSVEKLTPGTCHNCKRPAYTYSVYSLRHRGYVPLCEDCMRDEAADLRYVAEENARRRQALEAD